MKSLLIAAVLGIVGPPTPSKEERKAERQTLSGAFERANRALEPWNRGVNMRRVNEGARGRVNSTNDAARDAELRRGETPGFSEWNWR